MEIRRLETITRLGLYDCDLSPDGQAVAAVYQEDEGPRLGIWRTRGCDWVHEIVLPGTAIEGAQLPARTPVPTYVRPRFSPDGQRLAAAHVQGGMTVWALPEGKVLFDHTFERGEAAAAHAFGPGGTTLAVAEGDRIQLWSVDERRWLATVAMPAEVASLRASADGQLLGVGLQAGGAAVVDVAGREVVAHRPEIAETVTSLAFAPDEPWLLAATAPSFAGAGGRREQAAHGWAHLWNYRTGQEIARIPCDYHAALLGGGQYVATLTDNSRSLWIWRIAEDQVVARIENVVPEVMVDEEGSFAGRHVTLAATPARGPRPELLPGAKRRGRGGAAEGPAGDVLAVAGLSRPFSAVGALHLYAFQAETVPQP